MLGRIPILDVRPLLEGGRYPAKAAVGETFEVSATVVREGHDALNAEVVLVDPAGARRAPQLMRRDEAEADRWKATVGADQPGPWGFEIQAWGDPVATWRHNAEIKIPADIDVELVFTEGALILERAAEQVEEPERTTLTDAIAAIRDDQRP